MEEHSNQVVPSTSCDWLDKCDDESCSNQVVPALLPNIVRIPNVEPCELLQSSTFPVPDNIPLDYTPVVAIENSLKALSLEGMQVVPSDSKCPTTDTVPMNPELKACSKKRSRSASKTSASKA